MAASDTLSVICSNLNVFMSDNHFRNLANMMFPNYNFYYNLIFEDERKGTFKKNWIFDDRKKCNVAKLAEAGFYFIGDENDVDTVACYLCKKVLNGWEEDDDPWTEHKKHAPNCIISQLGKPESQLTLKNFLDVMEIHIQNLVNQYRIEKEKKVKAQVQHFKKVFKANYSAIKQ